VSATAGAIRGPTFIKKNALKQKKMEFESKIPSEEHLA
jgi:hypothetical protein